MIQTFFIQRSMFLKRIPGRLPLSSIALSLIFVLSACGVDSTNSAPATDLRSDFSADSIKNVTGLSFQWKFQTGARIYYSPVVTDDMVYAASEDNHLYALYQSSGAVAWDFEVPELIREGSMLAGDGMIYIASLGGNIYALDANDGSLLWRKNIGIDVVEPPLLHEGTLYIATTHVWTGFTPDYSAKAKLVALDAASGAFQWEFEADNFNLAPPSIDRGTIYVGGNWTGPYVDEGGNNRIYALDLASCERGSCDILWTPYESEDGFPKTVYAYGGVVSYVGYRDFVRGIDTSTGEMSWSFYTGNWSPAFSFIENLIIVPAANNQVHAVDITTGELAWRYFTPEPYFNHVVVTPTIQDDVVYFMTKMDWNISALNAFTGEFLWTYETGMETTVTSPLALSKNMIFVSSWDGALYAYKMMRTN